MSANNNLQRMIVIPPNVFDKWKHIITEDQKLSVLDKNMKNILYNNKLDDIKKWHQYRENLLKYSFAKKGRITLDHSLKPLTSERSIQTNKIPKSNKIQQTIEEFQLNVPKRSVQSSQMNKPTSKYDDIDEVFYESHTTSMNKNIEGNDNNDDDNDNLMNIYDDDDDARALALLNEPRDVRILKERHSTDPSSYKAFELTNGVVVNVPTGRTTRSMKREAETKLLQSTLPFKKVKGPSKRPATEGFRKRSNTLQKSPENLNKNNISWTQYK